MSIKVVLWDVDGTLLNFEKAEAYGIRRCFEIFGLGECDDAMLRRYSAVNEAYWKRLERGEITKQQVLEGRFLEFFRNEGLPTDIIGAFNEEYQLRLGDRVFFCDQAQETVQALRGRVGQYAVSNGTLTAQRRKLAASGLDRLLDGVFISELVGAEKPAAAFFEAVWNEIGRFAPDEVMIVGDSLSSDMRGGRNAGILCCWYNPTDIKNTSDVQPDYEICSLAEVPDIVFPSAR